MTHDYKRHGATTLFAALSALDGSVIGSCKKRHRHSEWLQFLRQIDRETSQDKELHLICDNYATHKHPCFHVHFTPTYNALDRENGSNLTIELRRLS